MDLRLEDIRLWLARYLEQALELPAGSMQADRPFASYGLSSRGALQLVGALEDWLGLSLDDVLVYDHPTLDSLSRHLHGLTHA